MPSRTSCGCLWEDLTSPVTALEQSGPAADATREVKEGGCLTVEISLGHKKVPVTHLRKMMLEELQGRKSRRLCLAG